jgi:hypothetical protein
VSKTPAIESTVAAEATPTEAESAEAETAEDVNLDATLSEIDTMLLDAAVEEAAAAAEEIPGTVAGKGKKKAEDILEEEDFNFQDILGQELSKAKKEELKEYAISCGYRPSALLFGGVNEESLGSFGTTLGRRLSALYQRVLASRRLRRTSAGTGGSISPVVYFMLTLR